jgi:hypothetical protein
VVADRFLADKQLLGNVAGCFVLHKQFENFAFPIGEKEFAFVVAAFQRVSPLLARDWNDYKVKGYSQLYHMKGVGRWCGNPVILGVQPCSDSFADDGFPVMRYRRLPILFSPGLTIIYAMAAVPRNRANARFASAERPPERDFLLAVELLPFPVRH